MAEHIPNLWRLNEDARRLYSLYLAHLQANGHHARVVEACRRIRRFAADGPGAIEGYFTFSSEIDSLCALKEYQTAWRQQRFSERIRFGKRLNLTERKWTPNEAEELRYFYTPLLYFVGQYREGCSLLETALSFAFSGSKTRSYDILVYLYNGDEFPDHRCRVTLTHLYKQLGRELSDWQHWEAFVNGFHPRLFRLSGVPRDELLDDCGQLAVYFDRLMDVRGERVTSGVGGGQSDLIDSAAKVRKRQEATATKLEEFHAQISPVLQRMNAKLQELFPELKELPM